MSLESEAARLSGDRMTRAVNRLKKEALIEDGRRLRISESVALTLERLTKKTVTAEGQSTDT